MNHIDGTNQVNEIAPNGFENEDTNVRVRPRGSPGAEKPYCWQSKAPLRAIRNAFGDQSDLPYMIATYLALTEIASDEGSPRFTKRIAEIAAKSGAKYRKTLQMLASLRTIGVIAIETNRIGGKETARAPSTYTVLSLVHHKTNWVAHDTTKRPNQPKTSNHGVA